MRLSNQIQAEKRQKEGAIQSYEEDIIRLEKELGDAIKDRNDANGKLKAYKRLRDEDGCVIENGGRNAFNKPKNPSKVEACQAEAAKNIGTYTGIRNAANQIIKDHPVKIEQYKGYVSELKQDLARLDSELSKAISFELETNREVEIELSKGGNTVDSVIAREEQTGETDRYLLDITSDELKSKVKAEAGAIKNKSRALLFFGVGIGVLAIAITTFVLIKKFKKKI